MFQKIDSQVIREDLRCISIFMISYFGSDLQKVVIYGSFLKKSFKKDSDIDVAAILRNSKEWSWSKNPFFWELDSENIYRQNFVKELEEFLKEMDISRRYDIKVFTLRDLSLIEKFQESLNLGNLVPDIRSGKIIYKAGGGK